MPLPLPWLLMIGEAHAGPWARPAGEVYAKAGYGRFQGRSSFDEAAPSTTTDALELYGELGLGGAVEIDVAGQYVVQHTPVATGSGVQDLEVLTEWAPVSGTTAVALLAGLRVAPYPRGQTPELGPGGADLLVGAGWGRGFGPAWGAVDGMLRRRFGTPSTGLRLRTEWGVAPHGTGLAVNVELQPAAGRSADNGLGPAPIPRVFGLGTKAFYRTAAGVGLTGDAVWLPDLVNDGPGLRLGVGLTFEGTP